MLGIFRIVAIQWADERSWFDGKENMNEMYWCHCMLLLPSFPSSPLLLVIVDSKERSELFWCSRRVQDAKRTQREKSKEKEPEQALKM